MRRVLALALGLCLSTSPAFAAISQIAGTGTGNAISNLAFDPTSSITMTTTAAVNSGSLFVAILTVAVASGTSTGFTCTDSSSTNAWKQADNPAFNNDASVVIMYSNTISNVANGGTVTCPQNSGPAGIVGQLLAFSGAATNSFNTAAPAKTGTGTGSATIGPTGTLSCPGGGASCEVCVYGMVWAGSGTVTPDAGWTTTGNNGQIANGFKIVSASTAVSAAPSTTAASSNFGGALACFNIPSPSAPNNLSTLGVGH